jgi:hypothetical protein
VCGNLAAGLFSCLLIINNMTSAMAGTWQFEIFWNNRDQLSHNIFFVVLLLKIIRETIF